MKHLKWTILLATLRGFLVSAQGESSLAQDYKSLQEEHRKALAAADEPVNRRYRASLEKLLADAIERQDMEIAREIRQEIARLPASAGEPKPAAYGELLAKMIWDGALALKKEATGVTLEAAAAESPRLRTPQAYAPPFKISVRFVPDQTNTRLYYAKGVVIFNWEHKPTQVRVHDLLAHVPTPIENQGLQPGKEYLAVMEVSERVMNLVVAGQPIYSETGDYRSIKSPLAIGPAFGSKIRVLSFKVEKM